MNIKHVLVATFIGLAITQMHAQVVSINALNTAYTEDFNSLDSTTTPSDVLPSGWLIFEGGTGANADQKYRGGTGSSNSGETYSFGSSGDDRSYGSLASGTVLPKIGARFINNTGGTITEVSISLMMEQWRAGGSRTTPDSMTFGYGINTGSINTGTWTMVAELNLKSKTLGGAGRALDGNDTANKLSYTYTLTGLTFLAGDTLYIRWEDPNVTGSDDGLSIDDFSITANGNGGTVAPQAVTSVSFSNLAQTTATLSWTKPAGYIDGDMTTLVFLKQGSSITEGTPNGTITYLADPDFSAAGTPYQHDAAAKCILNGDGNSVSISGLSLASSYYALIYVFREADSMYSASATATGQTLASATTPVAISALLFTSTGTSSATITWNKPLSYNDANHTTLLFVKEASAVVQGIPSSDIVAYTADNDFSASNSSYQNDANARCVFKGDANTINLTGLNAGTAYYVLGYVVNDADSAYSAAITTNASTLANNPLPVSAIGITGITSTSARISWTKAADYVNTKYTTLVFVKAASAITSGTPTLAPSRYTANATINLGTAYQNDAAAKCVFRGDTNFITISGLTNATIYYVLVYVVRDADSVYSTGITTSGMAASVPPYYSIGSVTHVNATTGVADSLNVRTTLRGVTYGYNQRITGIQFVMRDVTGGITVFHASKNFGYTFTEGDSIEVQGTISTFRGLTEIQNLDTLILLGSNSPINTPRVVSKLDETTESDYIRVDNVSFVTPPSGTTWSTSSTNYPLLIDGTSDTVVVRITSSCELAGSPLPSTTLFSVIGVGTQNSSSSASPFAFNGYQLLPGKLTDIISITTGVKEVDANNGILIYPNPTHDHITIETNAGINTICVYDLMGREVLTTKVITNKLDISSLEKGVYLLKVNTSDSTYSKRIVID